MEQKRVTRMWKASLLTPLFVLLIAACGTATDTAPPPAVTMVAEVPTSTPNTPTAVPTTTTAATATPLLPTAAATAPQPTTTAPTATPGLDSETYAALGDPNAPIVMYEFSDFGCPSCRYYALNTFPTLKQEFIDTGLVYYVFKDFPVTSVHGDLAAMAAECAGDQGAYWAMHERLFVAPQEWNTDPASAQATFARYGNELNLDGAAIAQCVADERYRTDIDRDVAEAQSIGYFGTPTFFINRKMVQGALPPEAFRSALTRELSDMGILIDDYR